MRVVSGHFEPLTSNRYVSAIFKFVPEDNHVQTILAPCIRRCRVSGADVPAYSQAAEQPPEQSAPAAQPAPTPEVEPAPEIEQKLPDVEVIQEAPQPAPAKEAAPKPQPKPAAEEAASQPTPAAKPKKKKTAAKPKLASQKSAQVKPAAPPPEEFPEPQPPSVQDTFPPARRTAIAPPPGTLIVSGRRLRAHHHRDTARNRAPSKAKRCTDTLATKPGINASSFAPGASRPIVRGLDNNRVRVQENGIGSHDASTLSEDHAVPIDPYAADRVEVIRGPATLRYGSQGAGGVVSVENDRIPSVIPPGGFSGALRGGWSSLTTAATAVSKRPPEPTA